MIVALGVNPIKQSTHVDLDKLGGACNAVHTVPCMA
jgi:hypothetical protein